MIKQRLQKFYSQKSPLKNSLYKNALWILIFGLAIGYLLSPKVLFQNTIYNEGDIFPQLILAEKDLLIVDATSTELKKNKLLSELGPIFDYDPELKEKTKKNLTTAFESYEQTSIKIEEARVKIYLENRTLGKEYFYIHQKKSELEEDEKLHKIYKSYLDQQLSVLKTDDNQLTNTNLALKRKIDSDHSIAIQIIKDLTSKRKLLQQERDRVKKQINNQQKAKLKSTSQYKESKETALKKFLGTLDIKLTEDELKSLNFPFYDGNTKDLLIQLMEQSLSHKILLSKETFPLNLQEVAEERNLKTGTYTKIANIDSLLDVVQVKSNLGEILKNLALIEDDGRQINFMRLIGEKLIQPNLTENKKELQRRKNEIEERMNPVYISLKKGEMIARQGSKVTKRHVVLLESYQNALANTGKTPKIVGMILFSIFFFYLMFHSLQHRNLLIFHDFKQLCLIGIVILLTVTISKLGILIAETLETNYSQIPFRVYTYALPIAISGMLLGILANFEVAFIAGILSTFFISLLLQNNLLHFFYGLAGNFIAALPIANYTSRSDLIKHGIKISIVSVPASILIYLIEFNQIDASIGSVLIAAVSGGIIVAIFTTFLLPLFENLFDITTDARLLELSNMNHPALKELMFRAPGTYHHSIMVGNLAETSAALIGANPLLSRVSAYYHDIGKGFNPEFFIENCGRNIKTNHDYLNDPYKSAKIIIKHVENGVKLAEKHKLGSAICNIIREHHGLTQVRFFYYQAKERAKKSSSPIKDVDANLFRYNGPKPKTIESAVVMLSDSCEAATRSIDEPTKEKIGVMVHRVTDSLLQEGQLDDSGISLKDFKIVRNNIIEVLETVHHQRIKYPEQENTPIQIRKIN